MVAIKNMDMPCDCWNCDCTYENYIGETLCVFTRLPLYPMGSTYERDIGCPLVEVEINERDN